MHWVYILRCEGKVIYIGETKNLFSRLFQHINGGCSTTKKYPPLELIGLYKVTSNYNFLKYIKEVYNENIILDDKIENLREYLFSMDNYCLCRERSMFVENYMTEKVMDVSRYNEKYKVFGGKYIKDEVKNKGRIFEEDIYDRPLCFCGLPCEIRKTSCGIGRTKVTIIYTCCVKNIWDKMRVDVGLVYMASPCRYYKEYLDDIELRVLL
jgi:hypothetical protein